MQLKAKPKKNYEVLKCTKQAHLAAVHLPHKQHTSL